MYASLMGARGNKAEGGIHLWRLAMLTGTILTPAAFAIWNAPFLKLYAIG
jgi:hypothetical protein